MANQARLRLLLDCPSKAANAEHSKLSETNWNLLTRIGFHLNLLTPGRWFGVSHYQNTEVGAESDRLPPPKEESLTFFWLVVLFGRCGLLSWHGPQGIVDVLGARIGTWTGVRLHCPATGIHRYSQCDRSARRRASGPLRTRDCPLAEAVGAPSCRPAWIWALQSDRAVRLVVCKENINYYDKHLTSASLFLLWQLLW